MKRIAIPVENNKLSKYLGKCKHFEIVDINGKMIQKQVVEKPKFNTETNLLNWLIAKGVTDLIMFKIDKLKLQTLLTHKINLFIGIKVNDIEAIITDYLDGRLYSDGNIISEIIENENSKPI